MSKNCVICGKTSRIVWKLRKLRGKYNPTSKKRKKPNLQWVTLPASRQGGPQGQRVKACTKCIKTLAKRK